MARPPTELQYLIEGRGPRGIYRALRRHCCLNAEAPAHRRTFLAELRQALARLPGGLTLETNERGEPSGRFVAQLGGRTPYDELLDAVFPYLNDRGVEMSRTTATTPPARRDTRNWNFWQLQRFRR